MATPVRTEQTGWVDRACAVRSILRSVRQEKRRGDAAEIQRVRKQLGKRKKEEEGERHEHQQPTRCDRGSAPWCRALALLPCHTAAPLCRETGG